MQYLQKTFTVGPPEKFTCCERCVYGSGVHAYWCPVARQLIQKYFDKHSELFSVSGTEYYHTDIYNDLIDNLVQEVKIPRHR